MSKPSYARVQLQEAREWAMAAEVAEQDARRELEEVSAENDRLRAALEKIANSGNVHSGWLIKDAKAALGHHKVG